MTNTIDLHTHSTASDGIYSPSELLQQAHDIGLRTLALTDHDTTAGLDDAAEAALHLGVELIPGIELNTDVGNDEIHVLGYYLEYQRPEFQQILQVLRDARVRRGERMVELLNEQGVRITWERVREIAQGAVGRPHIARALMETGYVQSVSEAFDKYIGKNSPAYVPRYKLAPVDAIRLIRSANGLPVLAHPLQTPGLDELRKWLPQLVEAGMIGLEVYYGPYTEQEIETLYDLATQYHLIPTGGSDFHGPNMHPTPLGGRFVPFESVARLKEATLTFHGTTPPPFDLPPPVDE